MCDSLTTSYNGSAHATHHRPSTYANEFVPDTKSGNLSSGGNASTRVHVNVSDDDDDDEI